jgi:subtilisin family serine protease
MRDFDVLPVVSIGNDGPGMLRAPGYFNEAFSVGALNFDLQPAPFSGGGISPVTGKSEPDIMGFGVNVLSSLERDIDGRSIYGVMDGTSMAAPYVTGIAALCACADPKLQGERLRNYLVKHAIKINADPERVGAGLARFV